MMVPERWMVPAILALSLASAAYGQSTTPPATHHAKTKATSKVVTPDSGTAPEQANQPDSSAPLAETPNYDPPPPPPRPPDPEPPPPAAPVPAPVVQAAPAPVVEKTEPSPAPLRPMTPQEKQLEVDSSRLLTLVQELKEEVAKAGIDTLSLNALRKAEEIQRLSRDLKERLRSQSPAGAQ